MQSLLLITSAAVGWIQQLVLAMSLVDACFVFAAMVLIRLCRYAGMWIYALIALPGTFAHELAHFVVAWALAARPTYPSVLPVRTARGWRLGSVTFRVGYLRAMPIALAPLVLAPLALWWAATLLHPASWPLYGLHVWVVAALLTASLPSVTDLKLALPAMAVLAVIGLIAWMIW